MDFLLYDWVVAVYILIAAFHIAWSFVGLAWLRSENSDTGCVRDQCSVPAAWRVEGLQLNLPIVLANVA